MLKKDAIAHFETEAALAKALGIKQQSVQSWGKRVPLLRQLQLERITGGALKADLSRVEKLAALPVVSEAHR